MIDPDEFAAFSERVAIGSLAFLEQARKWVKSVSPEHSNRSFAASRVPFDKIVTVVEQIKGETFADFRDRHGDWGLGLVLYLARRRSGLTLSHIIDPKAIHTPALTASPQGGNRAVRNREIR